MLLASLQNVTKLYGAQSVLQGCSFQVSSGQKLGLIGPNGCGKTTILRILLGTEEPTDGIAILSNGVSVGYVPQHVDYNEDETVMECVLGEHRSLTTALREHEEQMAKASGDELQKALRAYQRARDAYDHAGGDDFPRRSQAMLDALGLAGRKDQKISSLSGGEKNVLSMTKALLAEPDLLILDEPANHLDYTGVAWLEAFLSRFKGAVLIVSHNRYLLDRVVKGILHLEGGSIRYYDGNYSTYRATRLRQLLAQQADYVANQKRLAQLEQLVQRFANIARTRSDPTWGKRLKARRSQLEREKAQAVEKPTINESAIRASFSTERTHGNIALQLRDYSKAFGSLSLLEGAEFDMSCGERVALVGPNGCGKTSLLRDVIEHGAWENSTIRVGPSLQIGYCSQEQEILSSDKSIYDEIMSLPGMSRGLARGLLARFLFYDDDLKKKASDLSGGERNRLQLARLMYLKPNFLILDEPTNHLDILAREAIEEALTDFKGTLLVVSHDRYFLDKVVDRVVEVKDRKLISYSGNFSEYWFAKQAAMPRVTGRIGKRAKTRERAKVPRKTKVDVAKLEESISRVEREKVNLEQRVAAAFANSDYREGRQASKQLEHLQAELDALYEKWFDAGGGG